MAHVVGLLQQHAPLQLLALMTASDLQAWADWLASMLAAPKAHLQEARYKQRSECGDLNSKQLMHQAGCTICCEFQGRFWHEGQGSDSTDSASAHAAWAQGEGSLVMLLRKQYARIFLSTPRTLRVLTTSCFVHLSMQACVHPIRPICMQLSCECLTCSANGRLLYLLSGHWCCCQPGLLHLLL